MKAEDFDERVLKYLGKRKTAATIKQLAKVFNLTKQWMGMELLKLERQGLIKSIRVGATKFYAINPTGFKPVRSAPSKDGVIQPSQGSNQQS